jgi:hypothetical protein
MVYVCEQPQPRPRDGRYPAGAISAATRNAAPGSARASALRPHACRICSSAARKARVASYAARPRGEYRSAVVAKRRPPQHELLAGTDWRNALNTEGKRTHRNGRCAPQAAIAQPDHRTRRCRTASPNLSGRGAEKPRQSGATGTVPTAQVASGRADIQGSPQPSRHPCSRLPQPMHPAPLPAPTDRWAWSPASTPPHRTSWC